MKRFLVAARLILGLIFVVFGFDGIFNFFPMPPMPQPASAFLGALVATRLFYAVKLIEICGGILLLAGRYVTLAACMLAPVIFNIVWFDAALAPSGLPVGVVLMILEATLLWSNRAALRPLFAARSGAAPATTVS